MNLSCGFFAKPHAATIENAAWPRSSASNSLSRTVFHRHMDTVGQPRHRPAIRLPAHAGGRRTEAPLQIWDDLPTAIPVWAAELDSVECHLGADIDALLSVGEEAATVLRSERDSR